MKTLGIKLWSWKWNFKIEVNSISNILLRDRIINIEIIQYRFNIIEVELKPSISKQLRATTDRNATGLRLLLRWWAGQQSPQLPRPAAPPAPPAPSAQPAPAAALQRRYQWLQDHTAAMTGRSPDPYCCVCVCACKRASGSVASSSPSQTQPNTRRTAKPLGVTVMSILSFERVAWTRGYSAALLNDWFRRCCSSSFVSFEDQVCLTLLEWWMRSYVWGHWFGCSGRCWTHPGRWLHLRRDDLPFREHWPYRLRSSTAAVLKLACVFEPFRLWYAIARGWY